jgi:hypothetical protein
MKKSTNILLKMFLSLLIISGTTNVICKELKHYVELDLGKGANDYKSFGLNTTLGMNDDWSLIFNAFSSQTIEQDITYKTKEFEAGFEADTSENLNIWTTIIKGTESDDINYLSLSPGSSYIISNWWDANIDTIVTLSGQFTNFEQSQTTSGLLRNRTLTASFTQRRITAGLKQYLTESFKVYGSYSNYTYDMNPVELSNFLANRPNNFGSTQDLLNSLPKNSYSAGLTWLASNSFDLDLLYTNSQKAVDNLEAKTASIAPTFYFSDLSTTFTYSQTKQKDLADSDFYSVSIGISF